MKTKNTTIEKFIQYVVGKEHINIRQRQVESIVIAKAMGGREGIRGMFDNSNDINQGA